MDRIDEAKGLPAGENVRQQTCLRGFDDVDPFPLFIEHMAVEEL